MFACAMIACFAVMYINHANCTRPEVHARAAWGREYKVGRTQIHTCTLECERAACEPYMARSRDMI